MPGESVPVQVDFEDSPEYIKYTISIKAKKPAYFPGERGQYSIYNTKISKFGNFIELKRLIKNTGPAGTNHTKVIAAFYDSSFNLIDVKISYAEKSNLAASEISEFRVHIINREWPVAYKLIGHVLMVWE